MKKLPIGIIGCGKIAQNTYFPNFNGIYAPFVKTVACADLLPDLARKCAEQFSIPRTLTPDELLVDPEIALLVNLTIPEAHYELNKRALLAGKHVYCEKPLALNCAEAVELGNLAKQRGLMLSNAPDTILGATIQTARQSLDAGSIGQVRHVSAWFSLNVGLERYYRPAVGPILDFGPYYIGALLTLLGPITRVSALGDKLPLPDPNAPGSTFLPATPSHAAAALQFASGATGTLGMSADALMYDSSIEIIGSQGRLSLPDPNKFEGSVTVRDYQSGERQLENLFDFDGKHRGVGVADMALALREKRPRRIDTDLVVHSTEVLVSILESIRTGKTVSLTTTCQRPAPMSPKSTGTPFAIPARH